MAKNKTNRYYNCMGYALGIKKWLLMDYYYDIDDLEERFGHKIRRIGNRAAMVPGRAYVAYRYGYLDFHFVRRGKDGHWREKRGGGPIQPITERHVFSDAWHPETQNYNSKIYLYEVLD